MKLLSMERLTIFATLACTLKCKLCSAFSPYYTKSQQLTTAELKRHIDRCFEIINHVGILTLLGGEALLREDLAEIVDHIFKYTDKIDSFIFVTNGTIVPPTSCEQL